jgi:hypothetical protein
MPGADFGCPHSPLWIAVLSGQQSLGIQLIPGNFVESRADSPDIGDNGSKSNINLTHLSLRRH